MLRSIALVLVVSAITGVALWLLVTVIVELARLAAAALAVAGG